MNFDADILIMGAGVYGANQITAETHAALSRCARIFHLTVSEDVGRYLASNFSSAQSLVPLYVDGKLDLDVYHEIAQLVIDCARVLRPTGLLVVGHPSFYVSPTELILERAFRQGLTVHVYPAVSTLDAMMAMLRIDIGRTGVQIMDCNRLVTYALRPDARLPLLLYQIGTFGTGFITRTKRNSAGRFRELVDYLGTLYPPRHRVLIAECAMSAVHQGRWEWVPLQSLASHALSINYNSTLLVPPSRPLEVSDQRFFRGLTDIGLAGGMISTDDG